MKILYAGENYIIYKVVNYALSSLYLKVHVFIVMLSLLVKNVIGGNYVSGSLSNIISGIEKGTTCM